MMLPLVLVCLTCHIYSCNTHEKQIVVVGSDGAARKGMPAFGENKPKFNPIHDETAGLETVVENAATAPANAGYRM
jgi:hypothetical protein